VQTQPSQTYTNLQTHELEDSMRSTAIAVSLLTVIIVGLALPSQLAAQTWSAEQQEVWQVYEEYWAAWLEKDGAAVSEFFHNDYSWWWAEDVLPFGKSLILEYGDAGLRDSNQTVIVDARPVAILVHGDVALVHYGARGFTKDADGNVDAWVERGSMTLVKEDGRWLFLGGAGMPLHYAPMKY